MPWHYLRNNEQVGPVTDDDLRDLAATGALLPNDSVWREGEADWASASRVTNLFDGDPAAPLALAPPAAAVPAPPIGYFNDADADAGVRKTLKGFPVVTGARGDWPLAEQDLRQLALTARARRPLLRAAALYTALFFAGTFVAVLQLVIFLKVTDRMGGAGIPAQASAEALGWIGVVAGLSGLCLFAARGTYRAQLWAPATMIVHFVGWIAYLVYQFVTLYRAFGGIPEEVMIFFLFSLVPPAAFIVLSIHALTCVRPFLRRPLWTVHALVQSNL